MSFVFCLSSSQLPPKNFCQLMNRDFTAFLKMQMSINKKWSLKNMIVNIQSK